MFNRINVIVLFVLLPTFLLPKELDLEIKNNGIFSKSQNRVISNKTFDNNAVTYSYNISESKALGLVLERESFNNYKTQCYMPLRKEGSNYYSEYVNCITINLQNGRIPVWITKVKKFKKNKIENLNLDECFTQDSNSVTIIDSIQNINHLIFENVPAYINSNIVYQRHVYDINSMEDNFPFISLLPLIEQYSKYKTIRIQKQPLYSSPNQKTKMYLLKGDKVEILEEKDDWYYILYHGKKDIKAWIPKRAIEETQIKEEIELVSKLNQNAEIQS